MCVCECITEAPKQVGDRCSDTRHHPTARSGTSVYVYLVVGVYQGLLGLYAGPIQALYDSPATSDVSYVCVSLSISGHI